MEAVFLRVLDLSAAACWVIALVLGARLLLRRAPRRFACLLWAVVLVRLLCPFALESPVSLLPRQAEEPFRQAVQAQLPREIPAPGDGGPAAAPENGGTAPAPDTGHRARGVDWLRVGGLVWVSGCAALALAGLFSLLRLRRALVGCVRLEGNLWLSDYIGTAFVLGLFRPRIYLPSVLEEGERAYILLHERTHIRRGDHLWRLLSWLALCLHWFNPLVWLAFHLSARDMEMACDEAVLRGTEGDIRRAYSASLLRLAAGRRLFPAPLAFGEGDPKGRVRHVLRYRRPALWALIAAGAAVAVLAVCLLTNPATPPEPAVRPMTLEDVAALSLKGEALSWADLEPFESTEVGSGLYIRHYPVRDAGYDLLVGGPSPEEAPWYAYLREGGSHVNLCDIRTGDLEAFLAPKRPMTLEEARALSAQNGLTWADLAPFERREVGADWPLVLFPAGEDYLLEATPQADGTVLALLEERDAGREGDMDGYTLRETADVGGGRTLTLELHGQAYRYFYGISRIDVYDGARLLQTIRTLDAIHTQWPDQENPCTEAWSRDGGLTLTDMNFDGAADIGLMAWVTAGANVPCYYWLWNPEAERFEYGFCLCNAVPDGEAGQIVSETHGGADYYTERFAYGGDGRLRLVERVCATYGGPEGPVTTRAGEAELAEINADPFW